MAREVERSRTPALAALFLRELSALARSRGPARGHAGPAGVGQHGVRRTPGAVDGLFEGPTAWMRDRSARRGRVRRPCPRPRPRAGRAARRRARGAGGGGARPAGAGEARRRRSSAWEPGGGPLTVRAGWATRPGGLELMMTGGRARRRGVRGGSSCTATAAGPSVVGAEPDAGEALRAFTGRLRARRSPATASRRRPRAGGARGRGAGGLTCRSVWCVRRVLPSVLELPERGPGPDGDARQRRTRRAGLHRCPRADAGLGEGGAAASRRR